MVVNTKTGISLMSWSEYDDDDGDVLIYFLK